MTSINSRRLILLGEGVRFLMEPFQAPIWEHHSTTGSCCHNQDVLLINYHTWHLLCYGFGVFWVCFFLRLYMLLFSLNLKFSYKYFKLNVQVKTYNCIYKPLNLMIYESNNYDYIFFSVHWFFFLKTFTELEISSPLCALFFKLERFFLKIHFENQFKSLWSIHRSHCSTIDHDNHCKGFEFCPLCPAP